MTATTRPPGKRRGDRRPVRFSSLEILGFSDSSSTWSDSPEALPERPKRGRHEATVADVQPEELGGRLTGGNTRWGLVVTLLLLAAGVGGLGYWLYQRPAAQQGAAAVEVAALAADLQTALPTLKEFNENLDGAQTATREADLFRVESAARGLFGVSGDLDSTQTETRTATSQASAAALDAVRLANEARAYRAAVLPLLATPEVETDPALIELDEAARMFGDWQLGFDRVRSALPESALSEVTTQLDVLSAELTGFLGRYVDALREDDQLAAEGVLARLGQRLTDIEGTLHTTIEEIQSSIASRIAEASAALELILTRDQE